MSIDRFQKRLTAIAAATTLIGASAVAEVVEPDTVAPDVAPATAPAPVAYLRSTSASVNLSSSGAPVTLIKTAFLPAGTWLVTAKANPVNFGAADYVRCILSVAGIQQDAAATLVGNAAPGPTGETGPSVAEIVLQTAVTTTAPHTFALACQHDFANAGEYVDPGASLLIVKAAGPLG